jgi:hypothetical protein
VATLLRCRKRKLKDPRTEHTKEKHKIEWYKGIYAELFSKGETSTQAKTKEAKQPAAEGKKEDVIENKLNGKTATVVKQGATKRSLVIVPAPA